MPFEIVSRIYKIEVIAQGKRVRSRRALRQRFGYGRWRKMKGIAEVMYPDGSIWLAELHWYEAHGIGKRLFKVKKQLRQL